jgi:hypothetical protein
VDVYFGNYMDDQIDVLKKLTEIRSDLVAINKKMPEEENEELTIEKAKKIKEWKKYFYKYRYKYIDCQDEIAVDYHDDQTIKHLIVVFKSMDDLERI